MSNVVINRQALVASVRYLTARASGEGAGSARWVRGDYSREVRPLFDKSDDEPQAATEWCRQKIDNLCEQPAA